jgi:hypothetical protein
MAVARKAQYGTAWRLEERRLPVKLGVDLLQVLNEASLALRDDVSIYFSIAPLPRIVQHRQIALASTKCPSAVSWAVCTMFFLCWISASYATIISLNSVTSRHALLSFHISSSSRKGS